VRTSSGLELQLSELTEADLRELSDLFSLVVAEGGAFPQDPPAARSDFERAWLERKTAVVVARTAGALAGSYWLAPNHPGRAAHIANAGYMVERDLRRRGVGTALVEHSLDRARQHGFDALMFNLVFESNPSRRIYERLGFEVIGHVPDAAGGEPALLYWRAL
jgi:ribosomal protein S18 acetylase RimI-like enzyme